MKGLNHIDPNEKKPIRACMCLCARARVCMCVCCGWAMGVGWLGAEPALYQDPIVAACIGGPPTSL